MGCANKKIKIEDAQEQNSGEKIGIKSVEIPAEQVEEEPKIPDEQILADYDDGLSDALAEIETVG